MVAATHDETGEDVVFVVELVDTIDLQHYRLITLASCETALTGNQTITAEYVGLVSAFLSHRIPHILSTLWTVQSRAKTLPRVPSPALKYSLIKNVVILFTGAMGLLGGAGGVTVLTQKKELEPEKK